MSCLVTYSNIYWFDFIFQNIINMPHDIFQLCAMCHNLGPSKMNVHNGWPRSMFE
jgi:hypothetical protein